MNLTEMTARVREDLQDSDSQNYRWTTDEVEGAIQRAVLEYSMHAPIQQQNDIATTDASTELNISSLTDILQVESVEFPLGETPKHLQHTEYWSGKLYMQDEGDGSNARVRWLKKHSLGAQTTIPAHHEEILVLGATGYLAMSASANTVDRAFIAGHYGTTSYRAWGTDRLKRYDQQLKQVSQAHRVTQRQLYTEDSM
jgi:ureidoglycolate hydrolase